MKNQAMEHSMRLRGFKNSGKGQKGWAESFMIFDKMFARCLCFFALTLVVPGANRILWTNSTWLPPKVRWVGKPKSWMPLRRPPGCWQRLVTWGSARAVFEQILAKSHAHSSWCDWYVLFGDEPDWFHCQIVHNTRSVCPMDTYELLRHVNLTEAHRGIVTSSLSEKLTGRRPLWSIFWKLLTHSRHNYQAATRFKMFPCRFTLAWKTSVWFCDLCWFYSFPISFFWMHVAWWFWCIA